jgi:diaminohydroxyphosphoribosylaminopyrimidine deaminase / 5-amino-6-(5-phosphoribosylamino)uracil reductase
MPAMLTSADYMDRALSLAARGRGRTSPNPMVGAVVVTPDGVIVGQGFHERAGEPHAEVRALAEAGPRARGATLYCTLEPCCHVGRTGPCVDRIVDAGIARLVASTEDPNPKVGGRGFAYLRAHGVEVDVGSGAPAAARLNQPFFTLMRERRPFVILKAATSLDGRIAAAPGRPTRLTSAAADRHAHAVRAEVDAIGVGSGTIFADDPLLTARGPFRERPLARVIFDRRLRTPPSARVLSTVNAGPVMIVTTAQAAERAELRRPLEDRGAEIEVAADGTFRSALERLGARQIGSLLLEGGAAVHAAAWSEDLVDFARLYITPHVLGPEGVPLANGVPLSSVELIDRRAEILGPDTLIEGYVHRPR